MENVCPHCHKEPNIPDVLYLSCENYGDRTYNIECSHCGKVIKVYARRVVKIEGFGPSEEKDPDWPTAKPKAL